MLDGVGQFEGFLGSVDQHRAAALAEVAVPPRVRVRDGANVSYRDHDEDEDLEEGDLNSNLCCNSRLDFITSPRWQTCSITCRCVSQ